MLDSALAPLTQHAVSYCHCPLSLFCSSLFAHWDNILDRRWRRIFIISLSCHTPDTRHCVFVHFTLSSVLSDPPVFVRAVPDIVNYIHIMPIQRITLQLLIVKPRFLPRSYSSPGVRLCRQTVVPPRITFISSSMADYRWVLSNSGFQLSSRARSDLALALYRKNSSEHEPRLAIE